MAPPRRYTITEAFFRRIEGELAAYWLGFLLADGTSAQGKLLVELSAWDRLHLMRFREDLGSTHPIKVRVQKTFGGEYRAVVFVVACARLVRDLRSWGMVKGRAGVRLPDLPAAETRHLIRGMFDGDGCISVYRRANGKQEVEWSLAGNSELLDGVARILAAELGIPQARPFQKAGIWIIRYSGRRQAEKIGRWLYSGATRYLTRKRDPFTLIVEGEIGDAA